MLTVCLTVLQHLSSIFTALKVKFPLEQTLYSENLSPDILTVDIVKIFILSLGDGFEQLRGNWWYFWWVFVLEGVIVLYRMNCI